ncbi:MAG: FecR domain-containing protein [Bacteroidales bacterium]|nr:FecR domain-containing protein [Bacteroidales bacterium]
MKKKPTYWNNIAGYLSGEMNLVQTREFLDEVNKDQQLKNDFELMKRTWDQFNTNPGDKYRDTGKAWSKLNNRMEEDGLLEEHVPAVSIHKMQYFLRIAAVILVILAVGIPAVYYSADKGEQQEMVTYEAREGTLTVDLPDGSRVFLNQNAGLEVNNDFENARTVKLRGEGFFDVLADPERPFRVTSGKVTVTVLGTSFNIREAMDQSVEVFVESGKVRVDLADQDQCITLGPGQLGKANVMLETSTLDDDNYLSWKTKEFKFVDETVDNILQILERSYHVEVITENVNASGLRLTTSYSEQSFDAILSTICAALDMHYEKAGKVYILHAN